MNAYSIFSTIINPLLSDVNDQLDCFKWYVCFVIIVPSPLHNEVWLYDNAHVIKGYIIRTMLSRVIVREGSLVQLMVLKTY